MGFVRICKWLLLALYLPVLIFSLPLKEKIALTTDSNSNLNLNVSFSPSDDVVELTASNFNSKVIASDSEWLVNFYAPWCGHCRSLAPEWTKAATALKGIVSVGAVDMDVHGSVGGPYNIRGFPTIKIFGGNKNSPIDYNGARTAQALVNKAMEVAKSMVNDRLSGRGGSTSGGNTNKAQEDVVKLTDSNFNKTVFGDQGPWLVEFFAPWCGHCQNLAPEFKKAATELKGKVSLGAVDATVNTVVASKFGIQGYPTLIFFGRGEKDYTSGEDYTGGRTASDMVAWLLEEYQNDLPPPEIVQLTDQAKADTCLNDRPLCVISFLPDILDCQSDCRNNYLSTLKTVGEKYKKKLWGWIWVEAAAQPKLEESVGIGGFGFPAMAVVNKRKKVFVHLKGSFSDEGIDELLKSIAVGRGRTEKLPDLPAVVNTESWDGFDGEIPTEEYLEDIDLDDLDDGEDPSEL